MGDSGDEVWVKIGLLMEEFLGVQVLNNSKLKSQSLS